jgi:hypothetical protein
MTITISPSELILDTQNPRFIILKSREQADIRHYLLTYEDVCPLTSAINEYGSLLPGERIVALHEGDHYVVIEGNRRTCSLQILLQRELIPDGFAHQIPHTSERIIENCQTIEVDLLPDREAALELMTKRHIEGVKQWKPLAKKQFFASNFNDGIGQSIQNLAKITGVNESEIKQDIRDYKFFFASYEKYRSEHPEFSKEIIILKTDPFWRIFNSRFIYPVGTETKVKPKEFLKFKYDDIFSTSSLLDQTLFNRIVQLVFEKTIVDEEFNTRNILTDVDGILPLLQEVYECDQEEQPTDREHGEDANSDTRDETGATQPTGGESHGSSNTESGNAPQEDAAGGPHPGGPSPRSFFETISWRSKLDPSEPLHQGLLFAIDELYKLSTKQCDRKKAYELFPIATGMILRTVYEQALRLRLMKAGQWGNYITSIQSSRRQPLPTLSSMEDYINQGANKSIVFPDQTMILCFDRVIAATHRDFLNANIHYPGNINVTPDSLKSIAEGGMFTLIQKVINSL